MTPLRRMPPDAPQFLRFFGGSAAGLAIDLGGYAALTTAGIAPGIANLVSAFVSITVVYVLVTRYTFRVGTAARSYVLFVLWYGTSILVFSAVIEALVVGTGWPPLLCKAMTVPVSFALNYWFSRRLLGRSTRSVPV